MTSLFPPSNSSLLPPSDSVPSLIPPLSTDIPPPAPPSDSPPPTSSQPKQTTGSPPPTTPSTASGTSAPPPQSSTPAVPAAPAPSSPLSPPPSPPSTTPPPTSLPPSPPVLPPIAPPPSPPAVTSPPPQSSSPTPPLDVSPPPEVVPPPPSLARPPPQAVAPSPPSPANVPTTPSPNSPPPASDSPKSVPSPAVHTPPPRTSHSAPPPVVNSPPAPKLSSPPPSVPSTSSPPAVSPPARPSNSSTTGNPSTSPLPSIPTEKPMAKPTNGTTASANTPSRNAGAFGTGGAVAVGIIVGFVVLSLLAMAVWLKHKRKKKRAGDHIGYSMPSPFASSQQSGSGVNSGFLCSPSESDGVNNSRSWFTYEELVQATNAFSSQNVLGEGGFGSVFKGVLADGREVAVKQLKMGGSQGEREFRAEVEIISRVHHRHLVSLVGYCISDCQRLLVYDYVPNDTLHYHLHGEGRPVLDWATRVKVAAGAARGIAYLHEDCHPRIIHRDIKSSNILLDNNFEARVADFGLAKIALELDSNTHVSTRVMGTFGYMAPEYATSGKLTEKSDVYSFGVVLLELITGRKPVDDSQPLGDESLVEWARPLLAEALEREDFEAVVDPRLEKNYVNSEMFRMIEAAAACVRHSAVKDPE